ncbi:MAG: hypothetical protein ABEI31_07030 [Halodesulfurarchaeum sp.]
MNREVLEHRLERAFPGSAPERRAVSRMAADLHDSGMFREDEGHPLSPAVIVEHLRDAPDGRVADRWNWWMGALEHAHGGYVRFQVRAWERE